MNDKLSRRRWLSQGLLASGGLLVATDVASGLSNQNFLQDINRTLRLHWNENPWGPSPAAKEALLRAMTSANHYPDDLVDTLYQQLASKLGVDRNMIGLTSGSTEVLTLMGQMVAMIDGDIVSPWPSFPTLMMYGERLGARVHRVALDTEYRIDFKQLEAALKPETTLVFICNPNNPTATEVDPEALRSFIRKVPADVLILVDEAYIEFSKHGTKASVVPLVKEIPNLVVCRTFSKVYGLAGLRLGYAVSQKENILRIRERHPGSDFSINLAAVTAASASLADHAFVEMVASKTEQGKKILLSALDRWNIPYAESSTNFVYVSDQRFRPTLVQDLGEENILITRWPTMKDHIRISIQDLPDMEHFVQVLENHVV